MKSFKAAANKVGAAERIIKDVGYTGFGDEKGTSVIEISISCKNLINLDQASLSDPICTISHKPQYQRNWVELMRTEKLDDTLNPEFATKMRMIYRFAKSQFLRFHVYDVDNPRMPVTDEDSLGFLECTVANIVSSGPNGYTQDLQSMIMGRLDPHGTMTLIAEEMADLKDEVYLELCGKNVVSWNPCFKAKSCYVISRQNNAGTYIVSHRCEETVGIDPVWPSLLMPGRDLCNGEKDRQLKLEVWRKTKRRGDILVGVTFSTVNKMASKSEPLMPLQGPDGKASKASMTVVQCTITPIFTFMDFIQAGTRINLCFSIDFTSSNKDPTKPESLHFINEEDPTIMNPYEQAIRATGMIVQDYDDSNIFAVYGFGARIPPKGETSHSFPITFGSSPNCQGIDGVIQSYKACVPKIQLFGPTNFAPVIDIVAEKAKTSVNGLQYYVLVIVTDGVITDLTKTKEAIVKASALPMSIIIVGVGETDFSAMKVLDGDIEPISHGGKQAERDIVQFVEYGSADLWMKKTGEETGAKDISAVVNLMMNAEITNSTAQSQLAEEVLAEIPDQITNYMRQHQIEPSMVLKTIEDAKIKNTSQELTPPPDLVQELNGSESPQEEEEEEEEENE